MNQPSITAIIVSYNSINHIADALQSLCLAHENGILECVVVDNNSCDGTADFINANHPWVSLIRSDYNLGFGRGCNLGFKKVHTPYVLIHNPDAVVDFQSLQTLISFMHLHEKAGIVAPAIIEGESGLQSAGLMTTPVSLLRSVLGFSNANPEEQVIIPTAPPFKTSWVCGAMMLIRFDLYSSLGGFDPRFFLYFEETDFCRRASQAGKEIWAVGEAVAQHIGGASAKSNGQAMESSCISEHFYRSRFYYLAKHFGLFSAVISETLILIVQNLRNLVKYVFRKQILSIRTGKRPFLKYPAIPNETL